MARQLTASDADPWHRLRVTAFGFQISAPKPARPLQFPIGPHRVRVTQSRSRHSFHEAPGCWMISVYPTQGVWPSMRVPNLTGWGVLCIYLTSLLQAGLLPSAALASDSLKNSAC